MSRATALALAALALIGLARAPARAAQLVTVAPHSAAIGAPPQPRPLLGLLARPRGPGPFPAVVVLHGCAGFGLPDVIAAARLRAMGVIALAVDSLSGIDACRRPGGALAEARDALAAQAYLAARPDVIASRIAVLGFSMGGFAVLDAITAGGLASPGRFAAAVAFYPNCRLSAGVMTAPLLILMGSADDWTPAAACRAMLHRRGGRGAPVVLHVYPGATHAFDTPGPNRTVLGHRLRYDPAAARDAWRRVRAFLRVRLGGR
ncbi:MAG: dienelactone hydrolase family protein [Acetobacteraceae bacterium]